MLHETTFVEYSVHALRDEKGSPVQFRRYPRSCKSAAARRTFESLHPLFQSHLKWEGVQKAEKPEDLPLTRTIILLSGEKARDEVSDPRYSAPSFSAFFTFFLRAVTLNFFLC